jgi:hypothetical protein
MGYDERKTDNENDYNRDRQRGACERGVVRERRSKARSQEVQIPLGLHTNTKKVHANAIVSASEAAREHAAYW